MTTIAIDFNKKLLYMDSRATIYYDTPSIAGLFIPSFLLKPKKKSYHIDGFDKVFLSDRNTIITGAGNVSDICKFIKTRKNKHLKGGSVCWIITRFPFKVESYSYDNIEVYTSSSVDFQFIANGSGASCLSSICSYMRKNNIDIDLYDVFKHIKDPSTGGRTRIFNIYDGYYFEDMYE